MGLCMYVIYYIYKNLELFNENEQKNIVLAVAHNKILVLFVQMLLKNVNCSLVDVHKLGLVKPQHGVFYARI